MSLFVRGLRLRGRRGNRHDESTHSIESRSCLRRIRCDDAAGGRGPVHDCLRDLVPLNTGIFIANADGTNERMLVSDAMFDSNAAFAPDGRWVLFSSRRHGSVDIYRVQIDGTHLERLTDDVAFDDQAVMAPDGRHVAFVSSRSGQADIWLLDLQTRKVRNLTNHTGGDYRPAFSPDGQWIAFTSDRGSDGAWAKDPMPQLTQIYVMRADGSDVRRVTQGETSVGGASWSPDGKALVFFEADPEHWQQLGRTFPGPLAAVSQIGRVDLASGARTALTSGIRAEADAAVAAGWTHRIPAVGCRRGAAASSWCRGSGPAASRLLVGKEFVSRMAAMVPRASSPECSGAPTKSGSSSIVSWKARGRRFARCSAWTRSSGSFEQGRSPRTCPTAARLWTRTAAVGSARPTFPRRRGCSS